MRGKDAHGPAQAPRAPRVDMGRGRGPRPPPRRESPLGTAPAGRGDMRGPPPARVVRVLGGSGAGNGGGFGAAAAGGGAGQRRGAVAPARPRPPPG